MLFHKFEPFSGILVFLSHSRLAFLGVRRCPTHVCNSSTEELLLFKVLMILWCWDSGSVWKRGASKLVTCVFPSKPMHLVSVRNHLHVEFLENALQNPFKVTNVKW